MIGELIHRWKRWKDWRKLNNYSKLDQILIFLRIKKSDWFESFVNVDGRYENKK